ncbi:MAG TPA: phage integrase SAM-like domain-containing protein, partial [Pyrinomonadaceae bacterium]
MIKVFLREKKIKNGKKSLYLDFYPPITHPETNRQTRREHLRLHIYEKPKGETERDFNKETIRLAENIRAQRQLEFQAGIYGFVPVRNKQKSFLAYFKQMTEEKKKLSKSSFENWNSVYLHLKNFTGGECKF